MTESEATALNHGLRGSRVLVTGAASGIGAATAEMFAFQGAEVVAADIDTAGVERLVERLNGKHRAVRLDVGSMKEWEQLAGTLGSVDILVLNAGVIARPATAPLFDDPLDWIGEDVFERLVRVNLGGVLNGIRACTPLMHGRDGATILAVSSVAGIRPYQPDPIYSMTKHGVVGLCQSLAPTLAERGIRLVTVCPSGIETAMVPPDLRLKRSADGSFAPPSHMAQSILEIWRTALPGEIWLGRSSDKPRRYVPAAPAEPGVGTA